MRSRWDFERLAGALASSLISHLGGSARQAMDTAPTAVWQAIRLSQAQGLLDSYSRTVAKYSLELMQGTADSMEPWRRRNYSHSSSRVAWTAWSETPGMEQLVNSSAYTLAEALNIRRVGDVSLKLRDRYVPYDFALDRLCADAHVMVSEGFTYAQAIRHVTDELASTGGVKIVAGEREYDLYGYVRGRVYNDWARFNQAMRYQDGAIMGMDGVEVSAHWDCAPDHLPWQGRVYSKEDFQVIQGSLERPIGEGYNCRHLVIPCWRDSTSSYSEAQLREYRLQSEHIVEVGGNEMTRYQATQWQRGQERRVRDWKMKAQMCDSVGDDSRAAECRSKARVLQRELKRDCERAGLTYDSRRMSVGQLRP